MNKHYGRAQGQRGIMNRQDTQRTVAVTHQGFVGEFGTDQCHAQRESVMQ